jgi:hypothetical protein
MELIKMRIPGINPGVYSLDFVLMQMNYIDSRSQNEIIRLNKRTGRPKGHTNTEHVSHSESCRRWRVNNPEKYRKSNDKWNGYAKGMNGLRRLFGDDNRGYNYNGSRTCIFCGSLDSVHWRNGQYICNLCLCKNPSAVTA